LQNPHPKEMHLKKEKSKDWEMANYYYLAKYWHLDFEMPIVVLFLRPLIPVDRKAYL
jgi:hypothetical protein